tara:strand:+ start:4151 stop:5035 length:885 start_codon:yes stop_codon:yes gene_type:complete
MNKDVIYALDAKYKNGTINELYKKYVERSITVDTRFRDNYLKASASDYIINLPTPLNDVLELDVAQLQIPRSWYSISKTLGNNYFHIDGKSIIIPDGNYDAKTMESAINSILGSKLVTIDVYPDSGIGTNKTIFDNSITTVNFNLTLDGKSIDNTPLTLKLGWILGFRYGKYNSNSNTSKIVSEGLFDGYGPRYLYLAIDDYNHNTMADHYSILNSSIINKKIIASYSLLSNSDKPNGQDSNYYSKMVSFIRQYTGPVNINRLKIQLLDEYGRILDLNNMDYSFILKFKSLYIR